MANSSEHPAVSPGDVVSLQEEFPGFRIWREVTGDHARVVAVRRNLGTKPHTVVTADVAELRATLNGSIQHPTSP